MERSIPLGQPSSARPLRKKELESSAYVASELGKDQAYTPLPRTQEEQNVPAPKPKRWLYAAVAACLLATGAFGVFMSQHGSSAGSSASAGALVQSDQVLTVTGADVDQAATDQAIAELKNGTADATLAAVPEQVKQEILDGQRKFYRLPPLSSNSVESFRPGDRISVDFNGVLYGTYDLSKPITLDMPLKLGDEVGLHCLSVAQGKTALVVDLATVLNPVRSNSLQAGQSQLLRVQGGQGGQNYEWFEREAATGNPVAEYGLGHMYQYGLGVTQDNSQAIHWYQGAAAQNYLDAKAQLQLFQAAP